MEINVLKKRGLLVLEYEYQIAGQSLFTYSKQTMPVTDLAQWDDKISELLEGKYSGYTLEQVNNTGSAYFGCDILVKIGG